MKALQLTATFTLFLFSLQLLTGCSSMRAISPDRTPEQLAERIHPGDIAIIHTLSGAKYTITVDSIDSRGIHGDGKTIKLKYIEKLYIKQMDGLKTAGCIFGGYIGIPALLIFIVTLAAF